MWSRGASPRPTDRVHDYVLSISERRSRLRGWMIDDTGISKKGIHSVGVARQYCGQLGGKQDSCQVAVTLSLAADHASLPIAHRLYLPQAWAEQGTARNQAVPAFGPVRCVDDLAFAPVALPMPAEPSASPGVKELENGSRRVRFSGSVNAATSRLVLRQLGRRA